MERDNRVPETELPEQTPDLDGEGYRISEQEIDEEALIAAQEAFLDDPLVQAILQHVQAMRLFGGSTQIVPVRVPITEGAKLFRTVEWNVRWDSFMPAVSEQKQVEAPEENGSPEPVVAEG